MDELEDESNFRDEVDVEVGAREGFEGDIAKFAELLGETDDENVDTADVCSESEASKWIDLNGTERSQRTLGWEFAAE